MINIAVQGVALASIWFWIYSLFKEKDQSTRTLIWWVKIIVPQGIVIALALNHMGVI